MLALLLIVVVVGRLSTVRAEQSGARARTTPSPSAIAGHEQTTERAPSTRPLATTRPPSPSRSASASPPRSPSPSPSRSPEGPPVTIAFGGDVMFEGMIRPQLDADPVALLAPISPILGAADLAVVNLETAITTGGSPVPKQYVFRAPATGMQALRAAGVDVASLANNHGVDYGVQGLEDTLSAARENGITVVGAGDNAAGAYAPFTATIRGREIAIIGATQVMDAAFLATWPASEDRPGLASAKDEHEDRLLRAVEEARARSDTVVVYLHWGVEREHCPVEHQQTLARRLADAGADVVVGSHAHRLQGAGMLDGVLVGYGLGNFVFYTGEGPGVETGVLTVTIDGRDVVEYGWTPARLRQGIPHPLRGEEAATAFAAWEQLRECTDLSA